MNLLTNGKTLIYNECITFDNETISWDNEDIGFDVVCSLYVDLVVNFTISKAKSVEIELANETRTVNLEFNKQLTVIEWVAPANDTFTYTFPFTFKVGETEFPLRFTITFN